MRDFVGVHFVFLVHVAEKDESSEIAEGDDDSLDATEAADDDEEAPPGVVVGCSCCCSARSWVIGVAGHVFC